MTYFFLLKDSTAAINNPNVSIKDIALYAPLLLKIGVSLFYNKIIYHTNKKSTESGAFLLIILQACSKRFS
ncbi:hypothetical protein AYJ08_00195 [Brevibacillus sp. SKDU10]|nr:hypothetical protein AYJ08_00195 [Brevibacillus sp. SKDU10]